MGGYAWVTLATNDAYSLGALVLAHSLRRVGTKYELACMVTPGVTATMREKLAAVFSLVQEVNVLDSKDEANLALLARPELGITFTKLHCWRLTQYEKCVFVDADTLVVRNCDELFEREELSAAPDVGWPDCFNSGVFVFRPSQQTFASITAFAAAKGSFDGGDQGLLNMYFSDWATKDISKHLPFIYNMCSTATYSYLPAFKQFGEDVRIIHFIGITKPWLQYFDTLTGIVQPPPGSGHLQPLLQLWWNIFCERVHPQLSASMATSTLAPIWHAFAPAPPSYVPSVPLVYSDTTSHDVYSQTPDFSEFKDPWEEYSPQNDSFPINNNDLSNRSGNCYCGYEKANTVRQNDYNIPQLEHNQQFHYEQQHSFNVPTQTYSQQQYPIFNEHNQHQEQVTSHSGENYNQEYSVQHIQHHWQQHNEQRHHGEQQQHNEHKHYNEQHQWNEPRHHHEQHQFHEQKDHHEQHQYHEQRHHHEQHQHHEQRYHYDQNQHHEQKQHNEHHQHFAQSQQHDSSQNKTDDYNTQHQPVHQHYESQPYSIEVKHENHAQHHTNDGNQGNHQDANYDRTISQGSYVAGNENRHAQDKFTSHCCRCNEKSREQSLEAVNKQTDTRRINSYPLSPAPCTDLHNVATRSDLHVTEHLDNADMGIAGALAQLTLGEARSAEQIAFEEHMRKQSWEQGQIDYMGRDSFDNIWKKICETLSLAPQRQPTPPKEDTVESKESTAAAEPTVKTAAPVDVEVNKPAVEAPAQSVVCKVPEEKLSTAQTESVVTDARTLEQEAAALPSKENITVEAAATKVSSESGQPAATEDVCTKSPIELKDIKSCETSTEVPPPKPLVESLPTETITEQCKLASPPATQEVVCQDKSETKEPQQADSQAFTSLLAETVCKKETSTAVSSMPVTAKPEVPASAIQAATLHTSPISVDSPQTVAASLLQSKTPVEDATKCVIESIADVMQPLTIDPSEQRAEMLLAASEVSTMSPVPIQVAESVLQAEPKESVSGAVMVVGDQAIATTVTTVQDSTAVAPTSPIQLNGSACEIEARGAIPTDVVVVPDLSQKTDTPVEAKELAKEALSEVKPVTEEKIKFSSSVMLPEISSAKVKELPKPAEPIARTETAETKPSKPAEQIAKTEAPETKPAEQIAKTETAEAKLAEQIAKEEMAKEKPAEQIAKTETIKEKPVEEVAKAKTTEAIAKQPEIVTKAEMTEEKLAEQVKVEAAIAKSPSAVPKSPIAEPSPSTEVPIEAKAINIPSTPTVIEATPPTTPSVESAQEAEEKAAKKKKSDSPESVDGESADKKTAKKTMKKVTKKPKAKPEEPTPAATEGAAAAAPADNSQSKTKKTVKVTKKTGLKTGQTLETETNVPETPPPPSPASTASPDVPVPPKRKTKNSSASAKGSSGKKPEAEE